MPIHWTVQHVSNAGVYVYEMHGVNEDLSQVKMVVNSIWSNQNSLKIILGQVLNVRCAVLCFHGYFAAYDMWHKEGT